MPAWLASTIRFIVHPWTRYVLCWLAALGLTAIHLDLAWHMYDTVAVGDPAKDRRDANWGHTLVDYGGQWLTARLVATGRGRELYSRSAQREVLEAGYPREDEPPQVKAHDADNLLLWIMEVPSDRDAAEHGSDIDRRLLPLVSQRPAAELDPTPVSGPLYPPTHALLFATLGLLTPHQSYRVAQVIFLLSGWVSGLAIAGISRGRVWWPIATLFVMVYPGFGPALHLGQNSPLSLAILLVGWWLVARGWDGAGGAVWGLFAFKPVWAAAFLLVPLLTRRWRMLLAMLAVGIAFGLATIPIVGVHSWLHWLRIGQSAADLYKVDENWVFLSRDLLGIPRRWMLDFAVGPKPPDRVEAAIAGWSLWAVVVAGTAVVALVRGRAVRPDDGYGAAFVALGAWAACFHFMYYDTLLTALPLALLLTEPRRFIRPVLLSVSAAPRELAGYFGPWPMTEPPPTAAVPAGPRTVAVLNSVVLTALALLILNDQALTNATGHSLAVGLIDTDAPAVTHPLKFSFGQHGTPWDTFILLGLWAYCGLRVLTHRER